jgi:hypothetical protein
MKVEVEEQKKQKRRGGGECRLPFETKSLNFMIHTTPSFLRENHNWEG